MLKHPNSDTDFVPTPGYLVGGFSIYDREESLGQELNKFDPNVFSDLQQLTEKYFCRTSTVRSWSVHHKVFFLEMLTNAFQDRNYDFGRIIKDDHDECFYMPSGWQIDDVRLMFVRMYGILLEEWRDELTAINFVPTPVSTLG